MLCNKYPLKINVLEWLFIPLWVLYLSPLKWCLCGFGSSFIMTLESDAGWDIPRVRHFTLKAAIRSSRQAPGGKLVALWVSPCSGQLLPPVSYLSWHSQGRDSAAHTGQHWFIVVGNCTRRHLAGGAGDRLGCWQRHSEVIFFQCLDSFTWYY